MDSERSPANARIVSGALAELLRAIPDRSHDLVLVGGLVPPLLTVGSDRTHEGTTDVDLLLDVGMIFDDDLDFAWLQQALESAGFEPQGPGWRWTREASNLTVHLDLLCERSSDGNEFISLPGAPRAAALNLPGTRAARCDATRQVVSVVRGVECEVLVAGLGGFLLAKIAAIAKRNASKDLYDLAFVILHNPAGPDGAKEAVLAHPCSEHLEHYQYWMRAVRRSFETPDAEGPVAYGAAVARFGEDPEIAAQDAYAAVSAFLAGVEPQPPSVG